MADSSSPLVQIATAQAQKEVTVNNLVDALSPAAIFGRRAEACALLTWGYYGGRWGGTVVANGTLTLDASDDTYIVADRITGAVSASTATTNWDDTDNYARLYLVTTDAAAVTAYQDHRAGPYGVHTGGVGVSTLAALTDVDLEESSDAPADGDVLTYEAAGDRWIASPPAGGGAATSQPGEMIAGFIGSPSDKSYKLVVKAAHGGTITETTTVSASGTCTATVKINTTALGGTANSVSSSEQSQAHASANVFAAGDDIVLTISANSSCADLSFSIKYTRTLS